MFGGGGLNPRKMQKMMEQMGIELQELDVDQVVVSLSDGEDLVFKGPDVTRMEAQGQETYQIVGEPETSGGSEEDSSDTDDEVTEADIELVMERTGASEDDARQALETEDGDLAAAITRLS